VVIAITFGTVKKSTFPKRYPLLTGATKSESLTWFGEPIHFFEWSTPSNVPKICNTSQGPFGLYTDTQFGLGYFENLEKLAFMTCGAVPVREPTMTGQLSVGDGGVACETCRHRDTQLKVSPNSISGFYQMAFGSPADSLENGGTGAVAFKKTR